MSTAAEAIHAADSFLVFTGAGMGVDCVPSLPTFRGPTAKGWTHSLTGAAIDYYDICQPQYFRMPSSDMCAEAWKFWRSCREAYQAAVPHEGYHILKELTAGKPTEFVTTNVDCHHEKVGIQAYEIHGSIRHLQCARPDIANCTELHSWDAEECSECGGALRPNILMFHDADYIDDHQEELKEKYGTFIHEQEGKKLVMFSIGVGGTVPTIQGEIGYVRRYVSNATLVRINPYLPASPYTLAEEH